MSSSVNSGSGGDSSSNIARPVQLSEEEEARSLLSGAGSAADPVIEDLSRADGGADGEGIPDPEAQIVRSMMAPGGGGGRKAGSSGPGLSIESFVKANKLLIAVVGVSLLLFIVFFASSRPGKTSSSLELDEYRSWKRMTERARAAQAEEQKQEAHLKALMKLEQMGQLEGADAVFPDKDGSHYSRLYDAAVRQHAEAREKRQHALHHAAEEAAEEAMENAGEKHDDDDDDDHHARDDKDHDDDEHDDHVEHDARFKGDEGSKHRDAHDDDDHHDEVHNKPDDHDDHDEHDDDDDDAKHRRRRARLSDRINGGAVGFNPDTPVSSPPQPPMPGALSSSLDQMTQRAERRRIRNRLGQNGAGQRPIGPALPPIPPPEAQSELDGLMAGPAPPVLNVPVGGVAAGGDAEVPARAMGGRASQIQPHGGAAAARLQGRRGRRFGAGNASPAVEQPAPIVDDSVDIP